MGKRKIQNTIKEHEKLMKDLRVSSKHIQTKTKILNSLAKTAPEKIYLEDWTIQDCFFYLEARKRSGVSHFTYAREVRAIKSFFMAAENQGYIEKSPVKNLMLPPLPEPKKKHIWVVSSWQVRSLKECLAEQGYAVVVIVWALALRAKDIRALKEGDIDEIAMTLKCFHPEREIPIPDNAVLRALYLVIAYQAKGKTGSRTPSDSPLVTPGRSSGLFDNALKQAADYVDFPITTISRLREAAIYRWVLGGVDPRRIGLWAGISLVTAYRYMPCLETYPEAWNPPTGLEEEDETTV